MPCISTFLIPTQGVTILRKGAAPTALGGHFLARSASLCAFSATPRFALRILLRALRLRLRAGLRRKDLLTSFHGPKGPFFHLLPSFLLDNKANKIVISNVRS